MNLLERAVLATLPAIPRPLMRRLSARYIAGETIEEALAKLESLQGRGFPGVLDILGEDVADEAEAREVLGTYQAAATAAAERGLDSYVSIKPTHFGLRLSRDLCEELYDQLLAHCATIGVFARVEMEDHSTTDDTLAIFHSLRSRHDNVGIVTSLAPTAASASLSSRSLLDARSAPLSGRGSREPQSQEHEHKTQCYSTIIALQGLLLSTGG